MLPPVGQIQTPARVSVISEVNAFDAFKELQTRTKQKDATETALVSRS